MSSKKFLVLVALILVAMIVFLGVGQRSVTVISTPATLSAATEPPRGMIVEDEVAVPTVPLDVGLTAVPNEWPFSKMAPGVLRQAIDVDFALPDQTVPVELLPMPSISLSSGVDNKSHDAMTKILEDELGANTNVGEEESQANQKTYRHLRKRSMRASALRMQRLFEATFESVATTTPSLEWASEVLLQLWSATSEPQAMRQALEAEKHACIDQWLHSAASAGKGTSRGHSDLRDVVRCVSVVNDGGACSPAAVRILYAAFGDPYSFRHLQRRTQTTEVIARRLQDPNTFATPQQNNSTTFRYLKQMEWSFPNDLTTELNALMWPPIRSIRPKAVANDVIGAKDGICHDDSSKFQNFPLTPERRTRLRILLRLDVTDLWTQLYTNAPPSTNSEGDRCPLSTLAHSNRLVSFMRRTRWMFDAFVPPFLNESLAYQSAPVRLLSATSGFNRSDEFLRPPPQGMSTEEWARAVDATFRIEASRTVLGKVGSYKLSQLAAPLHYELDNVCLSPAGLGISAYSAPGFPSPKLPTELRDERRNRIRQIGIRRRASIPKHFVDVPLFLSTVQYQSDNLGHVLYRLGAQQSLMRDAWGPTNHLRLPPFATADEYVVAYVVIPNAVATFGERSSIRHFYQAFNQSWLSIATTAPVAKGATVDSIEEEEVCFRKAWIGQDALYMYHSLGTSPAMRKRYLQSAQASQKKVNSFFGYLKGRLQGCMLDPLLAFLNSPATARVKDDERIHMAGLRSWTRALAPTTTSPQQPKVLPIQVLVLQRRARRLGNLNKLLAAIALHYGVVKPVTDNITTPFELIDANFSKRPIVMTVVDVQDLPTAHQVALFSATDVLIGVHGTAFQWMLLMKRSAVVVELQYPGLGCVTQGVQGDASNPNCRLFCEFGKTSMAAQLTHVARMTYHGVFGDGHATKYNIIIEEPQFLATFEAALCSLHVGARYSTQACYAHFAK